MSTETFGTFEIGQRSTITSYLQQAGAKQKRRRRIRRRRIQRRRIQQAAPVCEDTLNVSRSDALRDLS
eukprot:scaffold7052_cov254-Pinguiococcus_pyrenoidosus.AAC.26